ncbi:MAG TPA: response regulator transcription factor [Terriglobia bacterium]|nr:response regulator transcription factor [Terriglobia bacterium]
MKGGTLRVLLVDDHDVVRRGLRALIEAHGGWEISGEAASGREAVEKANKLKPDIVVLDFGIPDMSGLEVARRILKARPETQVLVVTMHESEDLVGDILRAGIRGFVLKSDAGRELVAALEALGQHKPYFTPRVAQMVLDGFLTQAQPFDSGRVARNRLSPREREVVQLLAEGKSNKEIASRLHISVKTVEAHRSNIMHKLDLHSISQLTRYAIRNRLIAP